MFFNVNVVNFCLLYYYLYFMLNNISSYSPQPKKALRFCPDPLNVLSSTVQYPEYYIWLTFWGIYLSYGHRGLNKHILKMFVLFCCCCHSCITNFTVITVAVVYVQFLPLLRSFFVNDVVADAAISVVAAKILLLFVFYLLFSILWTYFQFMPVFGLNYAYIILLFRVFLGCVPYA